MSDEPDNTNAEEQATEEAPSKPGLLQRLKDAASPIREGKDFWQIPTLLLGTVLILVGLRAWVAGKPGPDFTGALDQVQAMIAEGQFEPAKTKLNEQIFPNLAHPEITINQRGRYHVLQADRMFLEQKQLGLDVAENHRRIRREYELAERVGLMQLEPEQVSRLANTLISLNEEELAHERIRSIPDSHVQLRHDLMQRITDIKLAAGDMPAALEFLREILDERDLNPATRHWAIARQSAIQIDNGFVLEAIDRLLIEVARINNWDTPSAGELFLLLGEAYYELGDREEASVNAMRAAETLPSGTLLRGDVDVLLAQLSQARDELEEARDEFTAVTQQYRETPVLLPALLGLAEVEASLGNPGEAMSAYATLIDRRDDGLVHPRLTTQDIVHSIDQFYRQQLDSGNFEEALSFAHLMQDAWGDQGPPPDVIGRIAHTRRSHAMHLINDPAKDEDGFMRVKSINLENYDPVMREQIRSLFANAAADYRTYARMSISDPKEMARALMLSADSFDRAGQTSNALEIFKEYVENHTDGPHVMDARYRVAQALQALQSFDDAVKTYEDIIESNSTSQHAYHSYIPLARCHLRADGDQAASRAENWLTRVLDGTYFDPSSLEYQEALTELARMYRRVGRYDAAIEKLEEVMDRYPDTPLRAELENDLADALRLSAAEIRETLQTQMPEKRRRDLEALRRERLRQALVLYQQVRDALDAPEVTDRTSVQDAVLRNAIFYRGDCAFDLGDNDQAIQYYDAAAQKYADDPASLVAMAQIVSCYERLGRLDEARTAEERARNRLLALPDSVWENGETTMSRQHWERWLNTRARLADAN